MSKLRHIIVAISRLVQTVAMNSNASNAWLSANDVYQLIVLVPLPSPDIRDQSLRQVRPGHVSSPQDCLDHKDQMHV
jgi:hypothetical protein